MTCAGVPALWPGGEGGLQQARPPQHVPDGAGLGRRAGAGRVRAATDQRLPRLLPAPRRLHSHPTVHGQALPPHLRHPLEVRIKLVTSDGGPNIRKQNRNKTKTQRGRTRPRLVFCQTLFRLFVNCRFLCFFCTCIALVSCLCPSTDLSFTVFIVFSTAAQPSTST